MKTSHAFLFPRGGKHLRSFLAAASIVLGLGGPRSAWAVSEPSALNGQKKSYASSWQDEIKEGAEADKEITEQMGLYDNPQVQAYADAVGRRVLQASTFASPSTPEMYRNTKFTFRVLDSDIVNAFALPGGYVYVTRGLMTHVDNEAQLAVVLGHEIGHVAARHSSQQARRSQWGQLGVIAGAILGQAVLGDRMPNLAENVLSTGSQAMKMFMLRYSREAETEADNLGVDYALNAGYAAGESARFFDALRREAQQEGQGIPTWLSSHPDPGNRAAHVVQLASARRNAGQAQQRVGTDEYLRVIDGMIVGEDPRQGFTQNGVFYHPTLHFQMPVAAGWKVDNQPTAVLMGEPSGKAVLGLKVAPANRTHDAATQFVSQNKVQVSGSGDTAINGLPATVIVGRATTDQGQVGVWDAFIELEGKVYSLLGYAPVASFDQMRPTFESVAAGFSPLRDPRLANVQPAHLRIVRAEHAGPFATFVPTSLPPKFTAETVAIMNQVALNENVPQGAPLKIPEVSPGTPAPSLSPPADQSPYPTNPSTFPQNYPAPTQNYPAGYPNPYPSTTPTYPQPAGSGYPPSSNYPSQTYPNSDGYPPSQYPSQSGYPASSYPPQSYPAQQNPYPSANPYPSPSQPNGYPPQNPYPPGTSSPPASYPPSSYPPAPGGYPQFPQSSVGAPTAPSPSSSPSYPPPTWPR